MNSAPRRPPYNSGGVLDSSTIVLRVPTTALRDVLEPWGLRLFQTEDSATAHPLVIDLWRVSGGHLQVGDLDQHALAERAGQSFAVSTGGSLGALVGAAYGATVGAASGVVAGMVNGPLGWWWGAATGWWTGAGAGAISGASAAASAFAPALGTFARELSEAASHLAGTYHEVLVAVPNVVRREGGDTRFMFVLGMFTDNPLAILGDRGLRAGYRKRPAAIACERFDRYAIQRGNEVCLAARFSSERERFWAPASALPWMPRVRSLLGQPLLGRLDDGTFAISHLDRGFEESTARFAAGCGQADVGTALLAGVPAGHYALASIADDPPFGLFHSSQLLVRLTNPRHDYTDF